MQEDDLKKYGEIYKEIMKLNLEDALQLAVNAETEEEKAFWKTIADYLLQIKQKQGYKKFLAAYKAYNDKIE